MGLRVSETEEDVAARHAIRNGNLIICIRMNMHTEEGGVWSGVRSLSLPLVIDIPSSWCA